MKYFKTLKLVDAERKEITYGEALGTVLGSYKDVEETREMLEHEGVIPCLFSIIEVEK